MCDNLVPQRTFGFHYEFKAKRRLLKAVERAFVDVHKMIERWRLFQYIRQSSASHYVAVDPFALDLCVNAKRGGQARVFYLPFEYYRNHAGVNERRKRQFIRIEKRHIPATEAWIVCGDAILAEYVKAYGCAERAHVVYNGWPKALPAQRKALRDAAGIAPEQIVLLYQGGISAARGVTDVVGALAHLPEQVCFVVLGYGHGVDELEQCARDAGVSHRVKVLPAVKQQCLMDYTADADVGLIPLRDIKSYRYACPGKLFEFIGAGLPLVVSDFPDLGRFVKTYGLGEVFKSGDSIDLARALQSLVISPAYRKQCSQNAQSLHANTVCWEVQSKKLCDIILRP